jgi:hypothetical protein
MCDTNTDCPHARCINDCRDCHYAAANCCPCVSPNRFTKKEKPIIAETIDEDFEMF